VPHYVVLYKLTDQGIRNIRQTVERARDSQAKSERLGFTVHEIFWTQGSYDIVAIMEAPDEQTMMAGLMNIGAAGNARSETLRAFTIDEMEQVVRRM
jgi:uncharacterized protein with GYD domain